MLGFKDRVLEDEYLENLVLCSQGRILLGYAGTMCLLLFGPVLQNLFGIPFIDILRYEDAQAGDTVAKVRRFVSFLRCFADFVLVFFQDLCSLFECSHSLRCLFRHKHRFLQLGEVQTQASLGCLHHRSGLPHRHRGDWLRLQQVSTLVDEDLWPRQLDDQARRVPPHAAVNDYRDELAVWDHNGTRFLHYFDLFRDHSNRSVCFFSLILLFFFWADPVVLPSCLNAFSQRKTCGATFQRRR